MNETNSKTVAPAKPANAPEPGGFPPLGTWESRNINGRQIERKLVKCEMTGAPFWRYQADEISVVQGGRSGIPHRRQIAPALYYGQSFAQSFESLTTGNAEKYVRMVARQPDAIQHEIDKLVEAGFAAVAALLKSQSPPEPKQPWDGLLIPLGVVNLDVTSASMFRIRPEEIHDCLARLASGDFGNLGTLESLKASITEDQRWYPRELSAGFQNVVALETGHGIVTGDYTLDHLESNGNARPAIFKGHRLIVRTLIVPGRETETRVSSRRAN